MKNIILKITTDAYCRLTICNATNDSYHTIEEPSQINVIELEDDIYELHFQDDYYNYHFEKIDGAGEYDINVILKESDDDIYCGKSRINTDCEYPHPECISDGKKLIYGYKDSSGKWIVPTKYDTAILFCEEQKLALVEQNGNNN